MVELAPGERPVLVRQVARRRQRAKVVVVPQAGRDEGRLVGVRADGAVLGADGRPAALGLHAAEVGLMERLLAAEADAVRHLVEAVAQRLRADPQRLEEHVVTRVARHR